MIPDNVTLIVKAPNQQIDDQNVECLSSWTVQQLKGHLSEVYPNNPSTDEQKIIYSGQLLDDSAVLKDVLRTYSDQLAHTMHLVCTPKRCAQPAGEALRRRHQATQPDPPPPRAEPPLPETRQNDQNHSAEMNRYMSTIANHFGRVPPHPASHVQGSHMQHQMLMMQHAYMQYMQQYQHFADAWQGNSMSGAQPMPNTEAMTEVPQQPAAAAPAAGDEPEERRDWLEHMYAGSRLAVLCCLVYLYSSPFRLLLVVMLAAAGYLLQVGFFRELGLNPVPANPPNLANAPNPADAPNQADTPNPANVPNQADTPNPANVPNQADTPNPANVPNQADTPNPANAPNPAAPPPETPPPQGYADPGHQHSLLAVTWMIFTSFFASLVPEINQ